MIPVKLRLSGFLSYRDQTTIDFNDFELACISGQNGAGKSSLLDAITWALFGQARRRDDAIINSSTDFAEVSLDFDYEGNRYRVLRSKPRDKTTILEFNSLDSDGSWKVLTEHTLRETEERIRRTLRMDYDTFTNASFFLQGKADQFAQQPPAERKRILTTILGLEVWETYREMAGNRRKVQEKKMAQIEGQLNEIESELSEENARIENLKKLEDELKILGELRKSKEDIFNNATRQAAEVEHDRSRVEDLSRQLQSSRQRREQRATQLSERKQEQRRYKDQLARADEIEKEYQRLQDIRKNLEDLNNLSSQYNTLMQDRTPFKVEIQSERARLETERDHLAKRKIEIENSERELPAIEREYNSGVTSIQQLSDSVAQRDALRDKLEILKQEKVGLEQENKILLVNKDEHLERVEKLEQAKEGVCPLCGSSLNETERIALIEKLKEEEIIIRNRLKDITANLNSYQKEIASTSNELNKLKGYDQQLRQSQQRVFQLETRLNTIRSAQEDWQQTDAIRLKEIGAILSKEEFAISAHQRLAEIDQKIQALDYDQAAHQTARQQELELRSVEIELRELVKARSTLEPLNRQINDLEADLRTDDQEIANQEARYTEEEVKYKQKAASLPDLISAEQELNRIKIDENQKRMEVGGARQKVEVLKDLKARKGELIIERDEINQRVARLKILERAFGKDGVPALLIEQALPEIEEQANTFLDRLSNGTMSVSIESLREYKDKKREDKKETLDIIISDTVGKREYEMFSGGEAFRINFAIRLALSRVLARRAGARLQTLVIDEGFGSQDADGRQRLIEAINLVREDFAKILVITHLEELKDAFPARIEVEKNSNGSSVRVLVA
jgi:exonuclease SbcC